MPGHETQAMASFYKSRVTRRGPSAACFTLALSQDGYKGNMQGLKGSRSCAKALVHLVQELADLHGPRYAEGEHTSGSNPGTLGDMIQL